MSSARFRVAILFFVCNADHHSIRAIYDRLMSVGEVGVVYMCPSKVCGHKHPCSATPVQGEIAGRIRHCERQLCQVVAENPRNEYVN
jgi:hypothetical protein